MAGSPEKVDRNIKIYNDYKKGLTYTALVVKYKLAQSVIFMIIKRMKAREVGSADNAPSK